MKSLIIIISLFTGIGSAKAIEFNAIPEKFKAQNTQVIFGLAPLKNGAIEVGVIFSLGSNSSPAEIIDYYKTYFSSEWMLCKSSHSPHNQWIVDRKNNKLRLLENYLWFNNQRHLSGAVRVSENATTKLKKVFVIQYYYKNEAQFNEEFGYLCN